MNKSQMHHAAGVLNDLLKISEECVQQSKVVLAATGEPQIQALLAETQHRLKTHADVLKQEIKQIVTHPGQEEPSGPVYQFWQDLNASITPRESRTVFAAYEFQVDAAQAAYKLAMIDSAIPAFMHRVIEEQHQVLRKAHDEVSAILERE